MRPHRLIVVYPSLQPDEDHQSFEVVDLKSFWKTLQIEVVAYTNLKTNLKGVNVG